MNNRNDKIRGSLIGGAIGDALGYPIEFSCGIKDKQQTTLGKKGIISDDTQMTLFTANAIIIRETKAILEQNTPSLIEVIYQAYQDWLSTQNQSKPQEKITWISDIPELNISRAPGITCLNALSSKIKGTIKHPLNNSKGCGGIMRVAPLGLYYSNPIKAGKLAANASALTHGHPLGIIPAYVFAVLISLIINEDIDLNTAIKQAIEIYDKNFDIYDQSIKKDFINLVTLAITLSKEKMPDTEAIKKLGEGWVAEETFAIAIYSCLKYPNNFEDAIICAVNHDGDSDSTGSVAGNIIGAYLGYTKIPVDFIEKLELKEIILELADDLSSTIPKKDLDWKNKYLKYSRD